MPTKYRVLRVLEEEGDESFVVVSDETEAHGPQQAIKKAADGIEIEEGDEEEFVAVPVSNWTRETVSSERPPARLRIKGAATNPDQTTIIVPPPSEPSEEPDAD